MDDFMQAIDGDWTETRGTGTVTRLSETLSLSAITMEGQATTYALTRSPRAGAQTTIALESDGERWALLRELCGIPLAIEHNERLDTILRVLGDLANIDGWSYKREGNIAKLQLAAGHRLELGSKENPACSTCYAIGEFIGIAPYAMIEMLTLYSAALHDIEKLSELAAHKIVRTPPPCAHPGVAHHDLCPLCGHYAE